MIVARSAAWLKRQSVWRHNGYIGSARMMEVQCNSIIDASTTTSEAKEIAVRIRADARLLRIALNERIDT
jgi:hypothetical protein